MKLGRRVSTQFKTYFCEDNFHHPDCSGDGPECRPSPELYWYRSASEHCLFAVRGKLRLQDKVCLPTWFAHERMQHSAKPEAFRTMVEKASPGPYLELFARKASVGWDVWGNQAPGAIVLEAPEGGSP